jgi:V/A-type H+-transporting ATPase subunit F
LREENCVDIFVVGDENTILGFSLMGIDGKVVESAEEARTALDDAVAREDVRIVLITEDWAAEMREKVDQLKMEMAEPLVLEVPGSAPEPTGPSLRELVEKAVGVRLGELGGR